MQNVDTIQCMKANLISHVTIQKGINSAVYEHVISGQYRITLNFNVLPSPSFHLSQLQYLEVSHIKYFISAQ